MKYCAHCGTALPTDDVKFCPDCGVPVRSARARVSRRSTGQYPVRRGLVWSTVGIVVVVALVLGLYFGLRGDGSGAVVTTTEPRVTSTGVTDTSVVASGDMEAYVNDMRAFSDKYWGDYENANVDFYKALGQIVYQGQTTVSRQQIDAAKTFTDIHVDMSNDLRWMDNVPADLYELHWSYIEAIEEMAGELDSIRLTLEDNDIEALRAEEANLYFWANELDSARDGFREKLGFVPSPFASAIG